MTIICATDFSPSSEAATRLSAALARRFDDSLLLVHAVEPFVATFPYGAQGAAEWDTGLRRAAETLMDELVKKVRAGGIAVEGRVVFGSPSGSIAEVVRGANPRVLVMGTHGRKGLARFFLGSVAAHTVASSPCPVLVTGSSALDLESWRRPDVPLRLLVGVDGTPASESALAWAGRFGTQTKSALTISRLYWPFSEAIRYGVDEPWVAEGVNPEVTRLVERDVRRLTERLPGAPNVEVNLRPAHVDAADVLIEEAKLRNATAMVIGVSHRRLEAWNALIPSAVLRSATVPVLCVPETPPAALATIPDVRSVLIATDLSEMSNSAVMQGYALLRAQGGRVELCHVHEHQPPAHPLSERYTGLPALDEKTRADIEAKLAKLVPADAEARGIVTKVSVLEGATAATAILQAGRRLDVDVVVLASHGRAGVKRAVLGSVAEEVTRHADRPVLVVHLRSR